MGRRLPNIIAAAILYFGLSSANAGSLPRSKSINLGFVGNLQITPTGLENIIERIFNLNKSFLESAMIDIATPSLGVTSAIDFPGPFGRIRISADALDLHRIEFSRIWTSCDVESCQIKLQLLELDLEAEIAIGYASSQVKKRVFYRLKGQDSQSKPTLTVTAAINFHSQADKVLSIDPKTTHIEIPDKSNFAMGFVNEDNGHTSEHSLPFNRSICNKLIEKILNDHAISPAISSLSKFLKSHHELNQYLHHFVQTRVPTIDMNALVDAFYIRKIHDSLDRMLNDISCRSDGGGTQFSQLQQYFNTYQSYIYKNRIFSNHVTDFLTNFRSQVETSISSKQKYELIHDLDTTLRFMAEQAEKTQKYSHLKFVFPAPNLVLNTGLLQLSLFFLADKAHNPNFQNVARHGKFYSADEHKIIAGLTYALRIIKLGEDHQIKKKQSAKVLKFLETFYDEWVDIFRSLRNLPSQKFLKYVNALLTAIKEHVLLCENGNHLDQLVKATERFELSLKWAADAGRSEDRKQHDFCLTIPTKFINSFLDNMFLTNRFENIQIKTSDKDILLDGRRDLKLRLLSPPEVVWDRERNKFSLVIKNLEASIYLAGRLRFTQTMSVNYYFVPDLNERGELFFRFSKVDGDFSLLPEKNDHFLKKLSVILSLGSIVSPALKLSIISPLVYAQINGIFSDFCIVLPNFPITSTLGLKQKLSTIKYNRENILVEAVIEDLYLR